MSNVNGKAGREANAIYQDNRLVAQVVDPQIDVEAKNIQFSELFQSDNLMLPDECEFQKYKILVQKIADATKLDRKTPEKGRILRGVSADIVGYNEQ